MRAPEADAKCLAANSTGGRRTFLNFSIPFFSSVYKVAQ